MGKLRNGQWISWPFKSVLDCIDMHQFVDIHRHEKPIPQVGSFYSDSFALMRVRQSILHASKFYLVLHITLYID